MWAHSLEFLDRRQADTDTDRHAHTHSGSPSFYSCSQEVKQVYTYLIVPILYKPDFTNFPKIGGMLVPAGAAVTKRYRLGVLNNRNVFARNSGSWEARGQCASRLGFF